MTVITGVDIGSGPDQVVTGVLQRVGRMNANGRIYPQAVWDMVTKAEEIMRQAVSKPLHQGPIAQIDVENMLRVAARSARVAYPTVTFDDDPRWVKAPREEPDDGVTVGPRLDMP